VLGIAALSRRDREAALHGIGTALAGYPDFSGLAFDTATDAMRRGDRETARTVMTAIRRSGIALDGPSAHVMSALARDLGEGDPGGTPQRP
jgi:hypothetical protein